LDALSQSATGPGCRHLACDAVHRAPGRPGRCARCTTLLAYAADRADLLAATTTSGRVALLIPGAPTAMSVSFGLLGTMRLATAGSAGPRAPAMSPASWATAAEMLTSQAASPEREQGRRRPTLTQALQVAAALHAPPVRWPRAPSTSSRRAHLPPGGGRWSERTAPTCRPPFPGA